MEAIGLIKKFAVATLFALPVFGQPVDLAVDVIPAQTSVVYGTSMQATVRVTNSGGVDASHGIAIDIHATNGAVFTNAAGTGWNCTLGAGHHEIGICERMATLSGVYPDILLDVTAPSSGSTFDILAGGNESTDAGAPQHDSETITLIRPFEFSATANIDPDPVYTGDLFTATYTMTNLGPQDSGNLQLQVTFEDLPSFVSASGSGWTCSHEDYPFVLCAHAAIAPSATTSVTVMAHAPLAGAPNTTNGALFSSGYVWDNPTAFDVLDHADLSIIIYGPDTASPDASVDHEVDITNAGPSVANDVSVALDATTSIVAASGSGWTCDTAACTRASIAAATVAPPIMVTTATPSSGTVTLNAAVTSATTDLVTSDNTASVEVEVGGFLLASNAPITGSGSGGTTITVNGAGFEPGAVVLIDHVPVPTTFVSPAMLKATTMPHAAGTVDLAVLNPGGAMASIMSAFRFEPAGSKRRSTRH